MPSSLIQNYFENTKRDLHQKIIERGFNPMTPEEKAAWIADEPRRMAASQEKYAQEHPTNFDPKTIGLSEDELSLDWSHVRPDISDGIKAVEAIRPALARGFGLIFLWGSYGQAKSLIGKILVARAYAAGKKAIYANFLEALDNIRLAFDELENKTSELIRRIDWWTGRDVLFLDEFDKSNDTPWALERKFQIVDRCYQRAIREEALTVIASNRGDDEVDGYIRSRLQDRRLGPMIYLNGPDARKVMPTSYRH